MGHHGRLTNLEALALIAFALEATDPRRKVGARVKALRKRRGMTQQKLAKKAGVNQSYIAKLEPSARKKRKKVRRTNPSPLILVKLARALGVPATALLK